MIRRLSILILAFSISTYALNAADNDDEIAEPLPKKGKISVQERKEDKEQKPQVAVDLSSKFRKDVVVELNLSNNKYLTDINFVLAFPNLIYLNLFCCYNLKNNYKQVSSLISLTRLNLQSVFLTSLRHISSLTNLTSLDLSSNFLKGKKIKYLIPLNKLKILSLRGNRDITDLERLSELKSLTCLNLSEIICYHPDTNEKPIHESIDFLVGIKLLSTLYLCSNDHLTYIKPLTKIPTLTNLSLCGCHSIRDLKNIKKIKKLKELDLRYIEQYSGISKHLNNLKELKFLNKLTISEHSISPLSFTRKIKVIVSP